MEPLKTYSDFIAEGLHDIDIPEILYHATLKSRLKSIKEKGLGASSRKMWSFSSPGVVCLTDDENCAFDFVYESEYAEEHDVDEENIIVLKINTNSLDKNLFVKDENFNTDEGFSICYKGIIPFSCVEAVLTYNDIAQ